MKNSLFFIICLIGSLPLSLFSQGYSIGTQPTSGDRYYHVGSLGKDNTTPHEKLKIEVLGGSISSSCLGEETFILSTRGGLKINNEVHYGGVANYSLYVFENGNQYDFVIKTTTGFWTTIWVKSWYIRPYFDSKPNEITPFVIKEYNPQGKTDVTAQFPPSTILATTNTGDVGIGIKNPQARLDVRGKIIADEVEIKVNKGADFVFDTDYQLKSLFEVEKFIKENKHLPGIQSEKEMQQSGLNLNEMQMRLLQKIEELTLYVIDLKKENEEQNKRIQKQEETIIKLQNK